MRIDRNMFGWGVFFVAAGAVPLAVEAGLVPADVAGEWASWWPLILVGIGLGLIFRRTVLEAVGGAVVAATFGLMVGGALSSGFEDVGGLPGGFCGGAETGAPFATQTGTFAGRASVELEADCGDLRVATIAGGSWTVAGSSADGVAPRLAVSADDLEVTTDDGDNAFFNRGSQIEVELPTDPVLAIDVAFSAGSLDINIAGASVDRLGVDLNAGDGHLRLGEAEALQELDLTVNAGRLVVDLPQVSTSGSIQVNAGNVDLCAPSGVGLRLETGENVIASYDFDDAGLVERDGVWETPGFDTAAVRIDLETRANAGSFSLETGTCGR